MRDTAIERGAEDTERRIRVKHQPERAESRVSSRNEQIGQRRRERACRGGERANQAVAGKDLRAAFVRAAVCQHGVFERHQHAEIAAGWVDGADEGDQHDQNKMLGARKCHTGRRHQAGAEHQQRAQIMARRDPADDQRQKRRAQERRRCDDADCDGVIAQQRHVGRQDDDRKTVSETAQASRDIEQRNQRGRG